MTKFFRKLSSSAYNFFIGNKILKDDEILDGKRVWFVSDPHFSHRNIIKYCRSDCFRNLQEMHSRIISNWNYKVGKHDRVYCLGDFGNFKFKKYLNGRITLAKGNHDKRQWNRQYILKYKDLTFLVIHDPYDATEWFNQGWIIHGHSHNNSPFIDIRRGKINVSVEVINYTPINMEDLYKIIKESKDYCANRQFL